MKKSFKLLSCLLVLLLGACASEDNQTPAPTKGVSSIRTADEAVEIANELFEMRHASRGTSRKAAKVANIEIIGSAKARSSSDTLIYAINNADNQGFTLVSAAQAGEAVIGFSDEGNYDGEKAEENPNFSFYLDAAKGYVRDGLSGGPIINPGFPKTYIRLMSDRTTPNYGQRYPEGVLCPNNIAGCGQTASAMALAYIEKPTSILYQCNEFGLTSEIFNWANLKKHVLSVNSQSTSSINAHLNDCELEADNHLVLSRICRELGYRNNATYNSSSTGSVPSNVRQTLFNLLPSGAVTSIRSFNSSNTNMFEEMFDIDCVAFVYGFREQDGAGHAWICDGGEDHVKESKVLNISGEWETVTEHTYYFHYNWGWCGYDNGFFLEGVFGNESTNFDQGVNYFLISK